MPVTIFTNFTDKDKTKAVDRLISGSTPSQDFFLMVILSILTATFGLLLDSVAVIIGSMLIAPILYPVLSLSLGIIMSDFRLISRSFWTVVKSLILGVAFANFATIIFASQLSDLTEEIISRAQPSLISVVVAIIAGLAASFALVKPQLNETLPGIAISVALIPPVAVMGIGLAKLDLILVSGSFLLFAVNMIGIVFASMITFSLMKFSNKKTEADKTIVKEERKIKSDNKKAERK